VWTRSASSWSASGYRKKPTCIAPYGRFVELGQRDITVNSRLDMAPFARNTSFTAYNLAYTLRQDPQAAHDVLAAVLALYEQGTLRGPQPVETFTFSQLANALRKMQTGRHIGKLVAVVEPDDVVKFQAPPASERPLFRPEASYLLVGGLGGLGTATALWMGSRGARHLLLLNRSGADNEAARTTMAALEADGCAVTALTCDIADEARLASVLAHARQNLPPIRGVVQGAMVLRDSMLDNMTLDDYTAVLRPKLHGTWNLHTHLPDDMDFFLLESSISGIVGNAAQSAYAAANTFLDAFARYQTSRGQPATTIDIGAVQGIGYLARNHELQLAMERQGFNFTDQSRLMRLLEFAIAHPLREPRRAHIVTGLGAWHPDTSLPALNAPLFSRYRILSSRGPSIDAPADNLRDTLKQSTNLDAAVTIIRGALVDQIVSRTGIPIENVNPAQSLQDYGIDSLAAVELRNWIAKDMDSVVPMLELLGAESLNALAAKIAARSRLIITRSTNGGS
jgi:NAD(P)-dependent dehydrogenase (short-subunit alcohol dehydrogenase family)/acyl carrier protein